jgi:hypothetical protein
MWPREPRHTPIGAHAQARGTGARGPPQHDVHEAGPQGVQVEAAHQLPEGRLLFHDHGRVPVLGEGTRAVMAAGEGAGVAGEQGARGPGQGAGPRADEPVEMIREEAQAETLQAPASDAATRWTKARRSRSSRKIPCRSRPRATL